jgi:hypothetical protein
VSNQLSKMALSLENSTIFNTNPACDGVGPSYTASETYGLGQLAFFASIVVVMFTLTSFALYRRRFRRRLRIRSPVPLLVGSYLGFALIIIRAYYNYVGREYFPCTFDLVLYYLF